MKHKFRGKLYKIVEIPIGECDAPDQDKPEIRIVMGIGGKKRLEIMIHESIHSCLWDLAESTVEEVAGDIARLLWKDGWRRKKSS